MVNAKMNKMHVHIASVSKKPQIELASSITQHSSLQPRAFAIAAEMFKINLCKRSEIIIGIMSRAIIIIAVIPQEFFIMVMLEVIVLNASFTVEPMTGMKLLIANFAVLIDKLSAACDIIFLHDNTNINVDIIKIVTPVKEFFKIFDIPLKSYCFANDFTIEKQIVILTIGNIKTIKNLSMIAINKTNEALAIPPLVILPDITYKVAINGEKLSIILHNVFI